jgi:hypothetical protein
MRSLIGEDRATKGVGSGWGRIADLQRHCEIVLMKVNYNEAVEATFADAASVSGLVNLSAK